MPRRGSTGDDSDNDFDDVGGGSDTDAGGGVTGDSGGETSYGGGGGGGDTDPDTGGSAGGDTSGGGDVGGDDDDDDYDPNPSDREVGGDSDTTYSGGGSDTDAGSGVTGDTGSDTTFEGGASEQNTTQTGSGLTGTDGDGEIESPGEGTTTVPESSPVDSDDGDGDLDLRESPVDDRGVGITRGPEGTTVVTPDQTPEGELSSTIEPSAGSEGADGELRPSDVTQFSQQQLNRQRSPSEGEIRAAVNRFGQRQLQRQNRPVGGFEGERLFSPTETSGPQLTAQDQFSTGRIQAPARQPSIPAGRPLDLGDTVVRVPVTERDRGLTAQDQFSTGRRDRIRATGETERLETLLNREAQEFSEAGGTLAAAAQPDRNVSAAARRRYGPLEQQPITGGTDETARATGAGVADAINPFGLAAGVKEVGETAAFAAGTTQDSDGLSAADRANIVAGQTAAARERAANAAIDNPRRTLATLTAGAATSAATGAAVGAAGQRAFLGLRGRLATRGMDFEGRVDFEDVGRPDVLSGQNKLTTFSEEAVPGGKRSTDPDTFPVETEPEDPAQELRNLADEFDDPAIRRALDADPDERTLFSARSGVKSDRFEPRSGRSYDPDAAFFAGSVSRNFLDVKGRPETGGRLRRPQPIAAARSLVDAARQENTPTIIATAGKIRELPDDVRSRGEITDFLQERRNTGEFFVRQSDNQSGEAEALVSAEGAESKDDPDPGAGRVESGETTELVEVGGPIRTDVRGETVPILAFRQDTPGVEQDVGQSTLFDSFLDDERGQLGASRRRTASRRTFEDLDSSPSYRPGGEPGTPTTPVASVGAGDEEGAATTTDDEPLPSTSRDEPDGLVNARPRDSETDPLVEVRPRREAGSGSVRMNQERTDSDSDTSSEDNLISPTPRDDEADDLVSATPRDSDSDDSLAEASDQDAPLLGGGSGSSSATPSREDRDTGIGSSGAPSGTRDRSNLIAPSLTSGVGGPAGSGFGSPFSPGLSSSGFGLSDSGPAAPSGIGSSSGYGSSTSVDTSPVTPGRGDRPRDRQRDWNFNFDTDRTRFRERTTESDRPYSVGYFNEFVADFTFGAAPTRAPSQQTLASFAGAEAFTEQLPTLRALEAEGSRREALEAAYDTFGVGDLTVTTDGDGGGGLL